MNLMRSLPVLILMGCSIDYGDPLVESFQDIPNAILEGFEQVSVRSNRPAFRLRAEIIESYNSKGIDVLQGVQINEYDEAGEVLTSGSAASATVNQQSRDGSFKQITVYSRRQKAEITASDLEWVDRLRQLRSSPQGLVTLQREDGIRLQGRGFFADFKKSLLSFDAEVTGVYDEDKKNASKTP